MQERHSFKLGFRMLLLRINLLLVGVFVLGIGFSFADSHTVLLMHFNEKQDSVVTDSSDYGNDGVVYGAGWMEGKFGTALYFDGVDDYVKIPNSESLYIGDEITIEFWLYVKTKPTSGYYSAVSKKDSYAVWSWTNGPLLFSTVFSAKNCASCMEGVSTGRWLYVACTHKNGVSRFYLNGKLQKNVGLETFRRNTEDLFLGIASKDSKNNRFFHGLIDELRISNVVRYTSDFTPPEQEFPNGGDQTIAGLTKSTAVTPIGTTKSVTIVDTEVKNFSSDWKGNKLANPGGNRKWGMGEGWWYNIAKVFYRNCEVKFWEDDATTFWIEGKGKGFFGAEFNWPYPLDKGFLYEFCTETVIPDYIAVNGLRVWDKTRDSVPKNKVTFEYFPGKDKENVKIMFIKNCKPHERNRMTFGRYFECRRCLLDSKSFQGKLLEEPLLQDRVEYISIDPTIALRRLEKMHKEPIDYIPPPVEKPKDYPGAEMLKFISFEQRGGVELQVLLEASCKNEMADGIIRLVTVSDLSKISLTASKAKEFQLHNLAFIVYLPFYDYFGKNAEKRAYETKQMIIKEAQKFLDEVPESKVYYTIGEIDGWGFGEWKGDKFQHSWFAGKYRELNQLDHFSALRKIMEITNLEFQEIKDGIDRKGKVCSMALICYAGFPASYLYHSGADIVVTKNIHRQNINIHVSNGRGAGRAYNKDYGFDFDFWDRQYLYSGIPDEIAQGLKVHFAAGSSLEFDEVDANASAYKLNRIGKALLDFAYYAKAHPRRGSQQVKIAIMRGFGEHWGRISNPSAGWESRPTSIVEESDFSLLNLVFASFGINYRTFTTRLCTGTPYGPVDMIPWDTPIEHLKTYKIVLFLGGPCAINKNTYNNLKKYVKNGGKLVMSLGQLRIEFPEKVRPFIKKNLIDLFGARIGRKNEMDNVPYHQLIVESKNVEVIFRLRNSVPLVIRNRLGKGEAYLFASEYLTAFGDGTAREIIVPLLEKAKIAEFNPGSSWLEYMVQRKGESYIFPIFNHGNIGFPSGNGRRTGTYKGEVTLYLNKLNIKGDKFEVNEVIYDPKKMPPFYLKRIKSEKVGEKIVFTLSIDKFKEIIISPKGYGKKDFFYGKVENETCGYMPSLPPSLYKSEDLNLGQELTLIR